LATVERRGYEGGGGKETHEYLFLVS